MKLELTIKYLDDVFDELDYRKEVEHYIVFYKEFFDLELYKEYKLESFYTPEVKMTSKTMKKRTAKAMRARSSEQRRAIMLGFKNKKEYNKAASKFKSL